MNDTFKNRVQKRQHLVAEAALQRLQLSQQAEILRKPLALVDNGLNIARYIKHHPILLASSATILTIANKSKAAKWVKRGWLTWQLTKRIINK
ncbi:MAG: YqjK-like family protein [Methylotenera sp.]|uniref:YqjK-like family protein n=1 Tax=Methylotenera sp. TaxID=2051956 RepID=UPI002489E695|nr:YqjK-like family protein [Methylotenera sp.]MDI1308063.1 YqjK-like family protein [Methylotenera sp.]